MVKVFKEVYPRYIKQLVNTKIISKENMYSVIVAPYISEITHNICKENGIGYFDYSGNCFFNTDSIYISEKGNPNTFKPKRSKNDIYNPKSIVSSKILRLIMKNANGTVKLQHLSKETQCSIGQVSKVKNSLCDNAFAEFTVDGLKITEATSIMKHWANAYIKKEIHRVLCFTLDSLPDFEKKLELMHQTLGIEYYLTGICGGARYAPVVRYNRVDIYIPPEKIFEALKFLNCKEVSSGANIIIYPLEDDVYTLDSRHINQLSIVSPIQAYLDCMQIEGRGKEIADKILEKEIIG